MRDASEVDCHVTSQFVLNAGSLARARRTVWLLIFKSFFASRGFKARSAVGRRGGNFAFFAQGTHVPCAPLEPVLQAGPEEGACSTRFTTSNPFT